MANHQQLFEFLERECRAARRDGQPTTLVPVDLDAFGLVLAGTDVQGARTIVDRARLGIERLQICAANGAPTPIVTASVAVATGVAAHHATWEELDLVKAARPRAA